MLILNIMKLIIENIKKIRKLNLSRSNYTNPECWIVYNYHENNRKEGSLGTAPK